jgi:hypothetical protein
MALYNAAGFLASSLVVIAFCMKDIVALRVVALASNVAFLIYGIGLHLLPVWLLHAALLPINALHLYQVVGCGRHAHRLPLETINRTSHAHHSGQPEGYANNNFQSTVTTKY